MGSQKSFSRFFCDASVRTLNEHVVDKDGATKVYIPVHPLVAQLAIPYNVAFYANYTRGVDRLSTRQQLATHADMRGISKEGSHVIV